MFGLASKPAVSANNQFKDNKRQVQFEAIKSDFNRHLRKDASKSIDKNDVLTFFTQTLTLKPIGANNSVARACQTLATFMRDESLRMTDKSRSVALLEALLEINASADVHKSADGKKTLGSLQNRLFIDKASVDAITQTIDTLKETPATRMTATKVGALPTYAPHISAVISPSAVGAPAAPTLKVGGIPITSTPEHATIPVIQASSSPTKGVQHDAEEEKEDSSANTSPTGSPNPFAKAAEDEPEQIPTPREALAIVDIVPEQQQGIGSGKDSLLTTLTEGLDESFVAHKKAALATIAPKE